MNKQKKNFNKKQRRVRQLRRRVIGVSVIVLVLSFILDWNITSQKNTNIKKHVDAAEVLTDTINGDVDKEENSEVKKIEETTVNQEVKRKIDPSKPMIALTFDDGPGERTTELLQVLERYEARATFFMCGTSLSRKDLEVSKILKKMDELGCDIGNHTMNHQQLTLLTPKQIRREVAGVNKIINKYTGHDAMFLRPPYGAGVRDNSVINNVNMPMVCWSVDTLDWKTKSKVKTMKAVLNEAEDGDIVLMHDIHSWSVDAAIEVIPRLVRKGYQLVAVSEMAEAKGVKLEKGKPYFEFK